MIRRKFLACMLAPAVLFPARLASQVPTDDGKMQALTEALSEATGGTIVLVPGGEYRRLELIDRHFPDDRPMTIRAADPEDPPRFYGMNLRRVSNVTVESLEFKYTFEDGNLDIHYQFNVFQSTNVEIRKCRFLGSHGPDGYGTGIGFRSRDNDHVRFEGNELSGFSRGMICRFTRGLEVRNNNIHSMRSDGMNFAQVSDALIEENWVHDFRKNPASGDHPDMIQFWTASTERPSVNVIIRNNLLLSGGGGWTQSIFIRNELVDTGQAGDEMYYRNLLIEGNLIVNAHLHGITVGETEGLEIRHNTVVRNPASEGPDANVGLWTPVIRLRGASRDVVVERNVTGGIDLPDPLPAGWTVRDNLVVQDRGRMEPAFYNTIFAGHDPLDPTSFRPLPGGPLDGTGLGSALPQRLFNRR